jgi:hypothetical protein
MLVHVHRSHLVIKLLTHRSRVLPASFAAFAILAALATGVYRHDLPFPNE